MYNEIKVDELKTVLPEYINDKKFNTRYLPKRQFFLLKYLIYVLSKITLLNRKYKIEKINMENLKPPYLLLCNHMFFVDFKINSIATFPYSVNNIVSIDGFYKRAWLMKLLGCIPIRKFTRDIAIIKQIKYCIDNYNSIVTIYPEARYSPIGTNSILPDSLGKLVKLLNVPVVILKNHGNYLTAPFWNFRKEIKVPLYASMKQVLTVQQIKNKKIEEINKIIRKEFIYDEYNWQKNNKISIPNRTLGLHKVLYQCPNCKTEYSMESNNNKLSCTSCKKEWLQNEFGVLKAVSGKTEFEHVPSWFEWQRQNIKDQMINNAYFFEDDVEIYSLKHPKEFLPLGVGKLVHDKHGFKLSGKYNNKDFTLYKSPTSMESLHSEYDYIYFKYTDCIDLSTHDDSFYCFTKKLNVITKLAIAVEEMHKFVRKKNNV